MRTNANKHQYLLLLFATLFLLISCHSSKPKEEHQKQLVVFCVLSPNLSTQTVIVDKTYSITETITDTTGISGATVLILDKELLDTIRFIESDTPGFYHDDTNTRWVKPLASYHLLVAYEGDTVLATTTVPDTFRITKPIAGETLHTSSLPIFTWTKSEGSKTYFIVPLQADTTDTLGFILPLITTDTFLDMNLYKDAYFDSSGFYQIKNFALDANRYRYEIGPPRIDTLGDGIGHFGSETFDTVRVYIIRD
ncbi:MAG: DUF4249 family protein [candidate division WOR-3 bacterium]